MRELNSKEIESVSGAGSTAGELASNLVKRLGDATVGFTDTFNTVAINGIKWGGNGGSFNWILGSVTQILGATLVPAVVAPIGAVAGFLYGADAVTSFNKKDRETTGQS